MNTKQNKDKKNIEYDIMGSSFLGSLIDMSGDMDSSGQNFAIYLESDKINQLKNNKNQNKDK